MCPRGCRAVVVVFEFDDADERLSSSRSFECLDKLQLPARKRVE